MAAGTGDVAGQQFTGKLANDSSWRRRVNRIHPIARKIGLGDRLQYITKEGYYEGPQSDAMSLLGDTGGVSANDIVYESGYDTTTGLRKVKPADADAAATMKNLWVCPAAIEADATGTGFKNYLMTAQNTNSGNVGDPVYLSGTAGEWTLSQPTTGFTNEIGTILAKSSTAGVISIELGSETIPIHDHSNNGNGGTLSGIDGLSGTTEAAFEVDTDGTKPALALGSQAAGTGDYTLTLKPASTLTGNADVTIPDGADTFCMIGATQTLTNKTLTTPTIGDFTNATHDHSDNANGGTITIAGITGTTSSTFSLLPAANEGDLVFSVTGGGSDNSVTITNTVVDSDIVLTLPNATDTFVCKATTDTLTNKTLTAPVINACTITGAVTITTPSVTGTWTDLGIVTTADINGGTIDGTVIGGSSAAAGDFTTIGASDDVTIAAGKDLILTKGAGEIKINAATSGGIIIKPTATTAYDVTLSTITQTTGTATLSIPNMNNVNDTIATLGLANAFTGACTFASITGNDAALNVTGTAGSGGAGGTLVMAGGAGDTNAAGGLISVTGGDGNGTGAGGAASLVGGASGNGAAANGGAITVTGGAGTGTGASDGGAVTITSGASAGASGTAGAVSIDTGSKTGGTAGAMTIGGTNTEALGIGNASCTTTITGALAMATDDNITLTSGGTNGYLALNGSTSGGIKLLPLATGTGTATITNQNVANSTITLPSATCTLPGLGLANSFTAAQTVAYSASLTNSVYDLLVLSHETDGTPAAGLGAGLSFKITDLTTATPEEQASIDAVMTDVTSTSEDCDLVFSVNSDGTIREALRILGDSETDSADNVIITGNTQETNGVVDVLTIKANPAAAVANGFGAGISIWLCNDAGSPVKEEHASIDFVTGASDGAEDTDIVFNTMLDGTVTEAWRLDASGNSLNLGAATGGSKVNMLTVHPPTTAKGSLVFKAVDNDAADVSTIIQNGQSGSASTFTLPTAVSGTVALTAQADGTIARSDIVQQDAVGYRIDLIGQTYTAAGALHDTTGGANIFKLSIGGFGTGGLKLVGEDALSNTKTDTLMFMFPVPPEYVASETITCKVNVKVDESGAGVAGTETLQIECYELNDEGSPGSDLASGGAQDLTAGGDGFQTVSSTITDAGIVPGDMLQFFVRLIVTETNGTAVHGEIGDIEIELDIKG